MTDDDGVGFKKPPKHAQFQKGQSGNPKGRPKGTKNLKTDLQEELQEQILVREGSQQKQISKQRAVVKSLMAKAVNGDSRAANLVLNMVYRMLEVDTAPEEKDISAEEQAIFDNFTIRLLQKESEKTDSKPTGNPDSIESHPQTNKPEGT